MRIDEELFRFERLDEIAARGTALTGSVTVVQPVEVRGIRVELVRTERSSSYGLATDGVLAEEHVSGPAVLAGGERFEISLKVPVAAVPGFTSPHGSLEWFVRVRADVRGSDPVAARPVVVADAPRSVDLTGPTHDVALKVVADATLRRCNSDRRQAQWLGWLFVAFGAVFFVAGAKWAGSPPEKWNGSKAPLWLAFGFGALLAGCGVLVVLSHRSRRDVPLRLATDRLGYRPGDAVAVSASNGSARTFSLALQQTEVRLRVAGTGKSRRVDAPQHVMWEEVRELPPGDHSWTFVLPADSHASYGGDTIAVAHRVVVRGSGRGRRRPLAEHHLVVVR